MILGLALNFFNLEGSASQVFPYVIGVILFFFIWLRKFYILAVSFSLAAININLVGVDPSDILIPILLVIGLLLGHLKISELRFPQLLWIFFAVFVFFYIVSIISGSYVTSFVVHLISNIAFLCFLKLYVDSEQRMKQVILAILIGMVLTSVLAAGIAFDYVPSSDKLFDVVRNFRYMSLMGDPNILAMQTIFITLWLLDEILVPKLLKVPRWITGTLLMLALVQLVLTQSRSGWLGMIVALSCYGLWDLGGGRVKKALTAGGIIVAALSITTVLLFTAGFEDILLSRLDSLVSHDSLAEEDRFGFFFTKMAVDLALDYPLGVGPGMTSSAMDLTSASGDLIGAHNSYIQILSDHGWGAFIAFFAMLMVIGKAFISKMTFDGVKYGVSYQFLFSGLAGLATFGMFQDLIVWQPAWIIPTLVMIVLWPTKNVSSNISGSK